MILKVTITTLEVLTSILVILCPLLRIIESFDLSEELNCLNCIGGISASLGIDTSKRCENYYCGQFQLSYTYWADAGKPGSMGGLRDFEKCARDRACAEQTIRAYFKKYKKDCDGDGKIDCADMAALHRGGPNLCSADWIYKTRYWNAFNKSQCMDYKNNGVVGNNDYILIDKRAKNESLTSDCLDCICEAISGCNMNVTNCNGGNICGPFGISQAYWKDGKKPGANWMACAKTKECSGVTMRNYMEKYKRDCNGDGVITCNDYAAIHRRGPQGCGSKDLQKDSYWHRFLTCRVNFVPNKDSNTVTLDNADRGSDLNTEQQNKEQQQQQNILLGSRNEPVGLLPSSSSASISTIIIKQQAAADLANSQPITIIQTPLHHQSNQPDYEGHKMMLKEKYNNQFTNTIDINPNRQLSAQTKSPVSTTPFPPREVVNPIGGQSNDDKDPYIVNDRRPIYQLLPTVKITESPLMTPSPMTLSTFDGSSSSSSTYQTTIATSTSQQQTEIQPPNNVATETKILTAQNETMQSGMLDSSLQTNPTINQQQQQQQQQQSSEVLNQDNLSDGGNSQDHFSSSFDHVASSVLTTAALSNSQPPVPLIIVKADTKASSEAEDLEWQQKQMQHQQIVMTRGGVSKEQQDISASSNAGARSGANNGGQVLANANSEHSVEDYNNNSDSMLFDTNNTSILNTPNRIASECLECICEASSNCDQSVQCISQKREKNRCGLYMISWEQYRESDVALIQTSFTTSSPDSQPLTQEQLEDKAYHECATERNCAERLIHLYIEKHLRDCNGDGKKDCYDVAALHRVGPSQCNSPKFLDSQYWKDFTGCYNVINKRRR